MTLSSERIANLLESPEQEDPLVITPEPNIDDLRKAGASSVDLRLGTWFVTLRRARMSHLRVDDATKKSAYSQFTKTHYVPFGSAFYLHPRAFVLGTTLEWIRLPKNLAGAVIGRSSWGRRGLIIATATGVHPGFTGCLTLELTNVGEIPVEIRPGVSTCQLVLQEVSRESDMIDRSPFVGQRMPVVGELAPDHVADKLARAFRIEDPVDADGAL